MKFLPDGRLLVAELAGRIRVIPSPYTTPDATPFLQISNIGSAGVQQGIYDFAFDPAFATNRYFYVFYTAGTPNRDRLSRFTANATLNGTVAGSELILYQDPLDANAEHHGGAIVFGNDGKLYFTTGEHFDAAEAQDLSNPRGKLHRINPDGTVPTDGPFYDGAGRNWDSIWAYGLRNPYRAFYDGPTGRLYIGDVGGNDYATAKEEVNIAARGANYGWPDHEGACPSPCTSPLYSCAHNGRDSAVTGGFVYHGTAFPAGYDGSYFFADYTQNCVKRLTVDAAGNLTGVYNFEPANGSVDGPYGDIVYLDRGPGPGVVLPRPRLLGHQRQLRREQGAPDQVRQRQPGSGRRRPAADVTSGPAPLSVTFSSAGSTDPEGHALTYAWDFGDNVTSTDGQPHAHVYTQPGRTRPGSPCRTGQTTPRRVPIAMPSGRPPIPTITSPTTGRTSSPTTSSVTREPERTPKTERCRRARSPGTSTSSTRATSTRARRSRASRAGPSRSRPAATTSVATPGTGSPSR